MDSFHTKLIAEGRGGRDWANTFTEIECLGGGKFAASISTGHRVFMDKVTGTITHVYAGFKFRMVENTNAAANKLDAAQYIQTNNAAEGLDNAIALVDDQFGVAASSREGGDVVMGNIDLHSSAHPIDAFNVTVTFQWTAADADQANLVFNDVQTFLVVKWY